MQIINIRTFSQVLTALALASLLQTSLAALPDSLNYQGFLTDSAGAPVDGPYNMTFRLYDVDAGGISLWGDTKLVTVQQGVFGVELGGASNPFPPGLFEQPLWLGLSIDTDPPMTPRRPITSTGFAFKADDANTLEGVSASTLDQSAHVTDMSNPHNVTAAQVGAADAGTLASHISNTANPHGVTAGQTGAPTSTEFSSHTGNSAAHHPRYTNGEAVASMGATSDANSLNHVKYTNSNAVAAILAADGAGSTLDSDKVDGLQASEIIDAAQDEVRTPISSLPYIISQSGSYYLTGNLDGSSGGINITADDVTLDLMGFTIDGGGGGVNDHGILIGDRTNVTIRNGTVKGFGLTGVYQGNSGFGGHKVINVNAINNGTLGTLQNQGIHINGNNSYIEGCMAAGNDGNGIDGGYSARVINNTAYGNGGDHAIWASFGAIISGNSVYNNTSISAIRGEYAVRISGNTVYNNTGTNAIYGHYGSIISGNTLYNNTVTYGIYGYDSNKIEGNTAYMNTAVYAIYGSTGSAITNNTAYNNSGWGIYGVAANLIRNNVLYLNNTGNAPNRGGMRTGHDSRVIGNSLDDNSQNNIYVSSGDNILMENHVTDSLNGINFASNGNYYRDNTAAGNTNAFVNGASQTDGGGNVAF